MISEKEIAEAIRHMRKTHSDFQEYEAKAAVSDVPKNIGETISAFANLHGGLIILGISEDDNFKPAKGFNADKIYAQMQTAGEAMTPVIRMEIEKVEFEGHLLVAARVPELNPDQKPCFISSRGRYQGSFIRTGDGDKKLSTYEISRMMENAQQPRHDLEPVLEATANDLDKKVIAAIIKKNREMSPRIFGQLSDEIILIQTGILVKINGKLHPTLAGLLAAGIYPQRFYPQLMISFAVYPGTSKSDGLASGIRYSDSRDIVGSIPNMLLDAIEQVNRHMNTGAMIEGALRKDVPDYPTVAVREAIANALQHRDYSPEGRGSQVQLNMYADRLEIINPGGLYGAASPESLGTAGISATRNQYLSSILAYTPFNDGYVVENKGTGFMMIRSSLAEALMPPPIVKSNYSFFKLTFEKRRESKDEINIRSSSSLTKAILAELAAKSSVSVKELAEMSGYSRATITSRIRSLVKEGRVEPIESRHSPKQRYRLVR
jgi:ATP-dependent DNA helicase RecG